MGEADSQPPIGWRYCGDQLKRWRERAGVTREKLADEAGYGYEAIKSMEQGRRRPSLRVLQVADQMCGAGGLLEAAHKYLQPERFVSYSQDFMRHEAEAIGISSYQPLLVPGLLQTEETMQALFAGYWPPRVDEETGTLVAARLERQQMLNKQTKVFNFVIGEAALREPLDGGESHRRQLLHLREQSRRRNVTVQVMPAGSGVHPGLDGSFVLLEMPDLDRLVYEEGQQSGVLYSEPDKVHVVSQRYVMIAQRALSPSESVRFIGKLAEEL
ncbi:helix-turn-helix domain-containing protein [Streptomyces sp. C36]|uniref:helix-turn-helix domain-containing protein n=1 Tax=Streptomyces sp. C36 TaxID=3237122 RepID=UPI0034C64FD7